MISSSLPSASAVALPRARFADVARPAVAQPRSDLLLVCVAGYLLTSVGRVHQLFGLEGLRLATLTGGMALCLFWLDADPRRTIRTLPALPTKWIAALLLWMCLSMPGALSQGTSFTLIADNFIKTALMYVVIVASARSARDIERLAFVYLAGAAIYAAVVVARFDVGSGGDWRLGHLYYYDANDFATFAVTAAPLGIYFLHAGRTTAMRLFAVLALMALSVAFVYSGSRGGFLAMLAVGAFVVVRFSGIPLRWRVTATAFVAIVVLGTASRQYWEQMGTIASDADYNRTGETGRMQIWSRGIGYMIDHPLLGVGPDNFGAAEGLLSPYAKRQQYGFGVRWSAAHNSFVQVGAELGLPGLAFYLLMLASTFAALRRTDRLRRRGIRIDAQTVELTQALRAALLGFVVGSFFLSLAYSEMLYTLIAMSAAMAKVTARPGEC
jgi:O-antigen ligase